MYLGGKAMISVEEIVDRIKQEESRKNQPDDIIVPSDNKSKCETIDNYVVPPFNIVESDAKGAKAKREKILSDILFFVDLAQRKRVINTCSIISIPTTANENLSIWGSAKNVSRAVDKMIEIGLLAEHDESYSHHASSKSKSRSKTYKYFYENEQKLLAYCKAHNIQKPIKTNVMVYTEKVKNAIADVDNAYKEFKIKDVVFSANLKLVKPLDITMSDFETYLTHCLYNNYPEFRFHQMKADEINEKYYKDYPEFAIRFKPHFTWNNETTVVKKIGIRATNSYCNKKKDEKPSILKKYGLELERDIKSSVPRLTLSLNTGEWVDESIDIYKLINDEFAPNSEFNDERREAIKNLHMSSYFDEHSDLVMGRNVWIRMNREGANKDEVYAVMKKLRQAIIKVEGGKFYGNEIFYVESCVYLMTLYDLLSAGHLCWLIYDGFYSKGESEQEDFNLMITNGVRLNFKAFYEKSKFKKI